MTIVLEDKMSAINIDDEKKPACIEGISLPNAPRLVTFPIAGAEPTGEKEVQATKSFHNTLIFFLSDNGASEEGGPWGFDRTAGGIVGESSSFASYGLSWAQVSDAPFRLYKHWVHEGGIATPLIVQWPDGIAARGELRHQPGHLIDIMATCVDVSGAQYPTRYQGREIQPMEGVSLAPGFEDKALEREAIYWEHEGNRAVRAGDWKLVAKGKQGRWELYNMKTDRTEMKNLAGVYPKRTEQMAALWQRYAERTNVLPLDERHWAERIGPTATFFQRSEATEFQLEYGDHLPRNGPVPNVAGKTITIRATIDARNRDGVLVAHGGRPEGYACLSGTEGWLWLYVASAN